MGIAFARQERQSGSEEGYGSVLAESSLESLKNMVLVMANSGVYKGAKDDTGRELWDLTWVLIEPFAPTLRQELYPDPAGEPTLSVDVADAPSRSAPTGEVMSDAKSP